MARFPTIVVAGGDNLHVQLLDSFPPTCCRIVYAASLANALDCAADASLVVVDATLQGGGVDLCRRLRSDAVTTHVPLILRVGYSFDDLDLNPYIYDFVTYSDNVREFDWSDGGMKVNRDLNRISGGIGYTTQSMSFDLSYGYSTWGITTNRNLKQTYQLHRVLASFAVRF